MGSSPPSLNVIERAFVPTARREGVFSLPSLPGWIPEAESCASALVIRRSSPHWGTWRSRTSQQVTCWFAGLSQETSVGNRVWNQTHPALCLDEWKLACIWIRHTKARHSEAALDGGKTFWTTKWDAQVKATRRARHESTGQWLVISVSSAGQTKHECPLGWALSVSRWHRPLVGVINREKTAWDPRPFHLSVTASRFWKGKDRRNSLARSASFLARS